jgi:hypothetical protein
VGPFTGAAPTVGWRGLAMGFPARHKGQHGSLPVLASSRSRTAAAAAADGGVDCQSCDHYFFKGGLRRQLELHSNGRPSASPLSETHNIHPEGVEAGRPRSQQAEPSLSHNLERKSQGSARAGAVTGTGRVRSSVSAAAGSPCGRAGSVGVDAAGRGLMHVLGAVPACYTYQKQRSTGNGLVAAHSYIGQREGAFMRETACRQSWVTGEHESRKLLGGCVCAAARNPLCLPGWHADAKEEVSGRQTASQQGRRGARPPILRRKIVALLRLHKGIRGGTRPRQSSVYKCREWSGAAELQCGWVTAAVVEDSHDVASLISPLLLTTTCCHVGWRTIMGCRAR